MADDTPAPWPRGAESTGVRILPPPRSALVDLSAELRENPPPEVAEIDARLSGEQLALTKQATKAMFDLRAVILEAADGYVQMANRHDFSDAWAWVEMLALAYRDTEDGFDLEHALGREIFLPEDGASFMGALEDSFVLAHSQNEQYHELALDWSEFAVRASGAGQALLGAGWEEVANETWDQSARTRATKRLAEQTYRKRKRKQLALPSRLQAGMTPRRRALNLGLQLDDAAAPLGGLYKALDPGSRAPTEEERNEGRARLEDVAAVLRGVDLRREMYDTGIYHHRTIPFISVIRSMMRNLELALSEDPEVRERAAPLLEFQQRLARYQQETLNR